MGDGFGDEGAAPSGDHSSYMPEPLLPLADVRIKVKGGSTLLAHAFKLVETCGAIAASSELFAVATPKCPATLSSPFTEYEEADVVSFLRYLYTAPGAGDYYLGSLPAVVRLAHALNAAPVLAAAQLHTLEVMEQVSLFSEIAEADELAALCGWDDVRAEGLGNIVDTLQMPPVAMTTPVMRALSDADAFEAARLLIKFCSPDLAVRAVGTLAANFRRLHTEASDAARDSVLIRSEAAVAARAAADGAAVEVDGCFVAAMDADDFSDEFLSHDAKFKSHGLEWVILLEPNGDNELDRKIVHGDNAAGHPFVCLVLRSGGPKKVRYQIGLINWREEPLLEFTATDIFTEGVSCSTFVINLTPEAFRDPLAGWVFLARAVPFVRILEVSDPTPEELAEME